MAEDGLRNDLDCLREWLEPTLATRRRLLGWLASASVTPVLGCDGAAPSLGPADAAGDAAAGSTAMDSGRGIPDGMAPDASHSAGAGNGPAASCQTTPIETGGPFPADSTIGPNVLLQSGIVRSDIRSSFAVGAATAGGVELKITLRVHSALGCLPRSGAVVYLWHCDREGRYSLYSPGVTDQDYLRGAQVTDSDGSATFTTIFPGCYPGRWPHMHFEVFASLDAATTAGTRPLLTSQLAFSDVDCTTAYAAPGYQTSLANMQLLSLETDGVFYDGADLQLAEISGTVASGLVAGLTVTL